MKISIITVCYNSEKTISQTFDSILNQNYSNIEYIVIDGKSSDKTLGIIEKYKKKFEEKKILFKYISEKDNGIYDAMNKGLELVTGDIVGIINSDDWYEENILERIMNEFIRDENLEILHGNLNIINEKNEIERLAIPEKIENLKRDMVLFHPTVFVKLNIYKKIRFNPNNRVASDYEFLLKNYLRNTNFKYLNLIIANFREGGTTTKLQLIAHKEVFSIQKSQNIKGMEKYITYYKKYIRYYKEIMKIKIKKIIKKGEN